MTKKWLLGILLVGAVLISMVTQLVTAQDSNDSLITINMAGINASFLTIGTEGIADSRLTVNTITITPEFTGVHVYPIICNFGLLRPGDIRTTESEFTIYNASNVSVNATISVAGDWVGTTNWTHSDNCIPGVATAGLMAIVEGSSGHTSIIVRKTAPYNYLITDLLPGEKCHFALEIYAPTEFGEYSKKTNSIIVTVSEMT